MYNVIIIGITLIALYNVFFREGLYHGLKWMVVCFFLGYRTVSLAPGFLIHPIDIIITALFIKALTLSSPGRSTYPSWLYFLLPFSIIAVLTGLDNAPNSATVWFDFKNFLLIFPLFYIVDQYLRRDGDLIRLAWISILTMTAISIFGLLEYYVPPFRNLLAGFFSPDAIVSAGDDGFIRASFSFWGAVTVGHIIISALPFLLLIPKNKQFLGSRLILVLTLLLLNLGALYITGNRADWLTAILLFTMYYFLYLGRKLSIGQVLATGLAMTITGLLVINQLGAAFLVRFMSGVDAITQRKTTFDAFDSSGYKRQQRIFDALDVALENPFGVGWSRSGWVHSDFVQILANTGWLPGLVFFLAFTGLGARSFRLLGHTRLTPREKDLVNVLLMCHAAVGIMLLVNNNYVLTQSGVPLFLLWALHHVYVTKLQRELYGRKTSRPRLQNQRIAAHV